MEFGKDNYDEEVLYQHPPTHHNTYEQTPTHQTAASPLTRTEVLKLEFVGERRECAEVVGEGKGGEGLANEFLCVGEEQQIQIPLLMTKDRLEQMEAERSAKEMEALSAGIKARQAFQVSEVVPESSDHFTTLIDVNQFIVHFYEFVMRTAAPT